jgi:hypothetical protein
MNAVRSHVFLKSTPEPRYELECAYILVLVSLNTDKDAVHRSACMQLTGMLVVLPSTVTVTAVPVPVGLSVHAATGTGSPTAESSAPPLPVSNVMLALQLPVDLVHAACADETGGNMAVP